MVLAQIEPGRLEIGIHFAGHTQGRDIIERAGGKCFLAWKIGDLPSYRSSTLGTELIVNLAATIAFSRISLRLAIEYRDVRGFRHDRNTIISACPQAHPPR